MEELLNSDIVTTGAGFVAGLLTAGLAFGARALIKSFKDSSNKLDDALIPLLESIAVALEGKKDDVDTTKDSE